MVIKANTDILLFRYSKYAQYNFLTEHTKILEKEGCVWILKAGRKTNETSIRNILSQGGGLVLKSPKSEGGKYSFCCYDCYSTERPEVSLFPSYYSEFIDSQYNDTEHQWFRVVKIVDMDENQIKSLRVKKNSKKVCETIKTTRTSVMFVYNDRNLIFEERA